MEIIKKTLILTGVFFAFSIINIFSNTVLAEENLILKSINEPEIKQKISINKVSNNKELIQTIKIDKNHKSEQVIFTIPFTFVNGEYIKISKNKDGKTVKSANIYDNNNISIGTISFEKDSNIQLNQKNESTLEVRSTSLEEDLEISFLVSSYSYEDYFFSSSWIDRDNLISLSINPKPLLWESGIFEGTSIRNDSWQKLLNKHSNDIQFYNENGLKDQYYCHVDFAKGNKVPWNIEPSRPNVGYLVTVLNACNP